MSQKTFTLTYISLMALGLLGMWLGFQNHGPSKYGFWIGPVMVLCAALSLLVFFRRDLRETEHEKRTEWERLKTKGRRSFILNQMLRGLIGLLPLLLVELYEIYSGSKSSEAQFQSLGKFAAIACIAIGLCFMWAAWWWRVQERKYAASF